MSERYEKSEQLLKRALNSIPLGTQTFSKSKTQYPFGISPYYIHRGKGSHVWDVDGNEYVDYVNSLAAVTLGYCDPDVDRAVKEQLEAGTIFSLPHPIEIEVAEKLVEMIPCAEMVRFGKNGSDATAGAIRIARAYTSRDHVAVCGYHGWQDWYIGSTPRNKGVPHAVQKLTHVFSYNDIGSLEKIFKDYPNEVAAVILEPMNYIEPLDQFLEKVREISHRYGALFIMDETITGFRYAKGGAQEYFGVIPDIATFGKGMANGYPVSAIVGRAEIMRMMEQIFYSFTFGGETLSLAASLATLSKIQKQPVIEKISESGGKIKIGVEHLIHKYNLEDYLSISGHPSWSFLNVKDTPKASNWELHTLFLQELFNRGILALGTHNMSYAHTDADIEALLTAYEEVFPLVSEVVENGNIGRYLNCAPLQPLFKVRK